MKIRTIAGTMAAAGILFQARAELVAYWDFEPENRYEDRSGNGADGVAGANVEVDPGSPAGDAISIGVSGAVPSDVVTILQDSFPALGLGDFSFSFWARRDDTAADTNEVDGIFDALRDTTQGFQALFVGNKLRFRMDEPGADFLLADSETAIPLDGVWRHFAVTVDRDGLEGLTIYIDGVIDSRHDPTSVSGIFDPLQDFWIGGINGSATLGLDGSLDDLAFYNVVLSPEQVLNLARGKNTPLTVFSPPRPPQLDFSHDSGSLSIAWESQDGMLYKLRSTTSLSLSAPEEWPLFDPGGDGGFEEIPATPPRNTVTFPLPPESQRYFTVEEFPPPPVVVFEDDFENGQGGWTTGTDNQPGTLWELGSPAAIGPAAAHSPANCFGTNLTAPYSSDADIWLRSPPITLLDVSEATLTYFRFNDVEPDFDRGVVSVLDASDESPLAVIESSIDGLSTTWESISTALPAAALGKTVIIEFRLTTDDLNDVDRGGFYVDDVQVSVP